MNGETTNLIKTIRTKLGLSTPQFSERLGYKSKSTIWLIEKGHRKPSLLMYQRILRIAKDELGMDITLDQLIGN